MPWGKFSLVALAAVGVWMLVEIAEAADELRANGVWGDWPHVHEGLKAPARKARGEGARVEQRPSVTHNNASLRTGTGA
jgi:hypothetical protein